MTKTVTLTAGHSNTDPGAVNGSDREADIAAGIRAIVILAGVMAALYMVWGEVQNG